MHLTINDEGRVTTRLTKRDIGCLTRSMKMLEILSTHQPLIKSYAEAAKGIGMVLAMFETKDREDGSESE